MDRNTGSLQSAENDARQKQAWNLKEPILEFAEILSPKKVIGVAESLVLSVGYMTSAAFTAALL